MGTILKPPSLVSSHGLTDFSSQRSALLRLYCKLCFLYFPQLCFTYISIFSLLRIFCSWVRANQNTISRVEPAPEVLHLQSSHHTALSCLLASPCRQWASWKQRSCGLRISMSIVTVPPTWSFIDPGREGFVSGTFCTEFSSLRTLKCYKWRNWSLEWQGSWPQTTEDIKNRFSKFPVSCSFMACLLYSK